MVRGRRRGRRRSRPVGNEQAEVDCSDRSFQRTVKLSTFACLALPRDFVRLFPGEFVANVTLQSNKDERRYPVKLIVNTMQPRTKHSPPASQVKFGRGWTCFVFDNSLVWGDRFAFTLIDRTSFFVRIDRTRPDVAGGTA